MKLLHNVARLIMGCGVMVAGVCLLYLALSTGRWESFIETVSASRLTTFCLGVAMFFFAVVFLLTSLNGQRNREFLSFDNDGGTVSISTAAISDYVSKLSPEFPSIVRMQPRVVPARNAMDIVVEVRVKAGPQISEMCTKLQERVRETVTNGLGIQAVRKVTVSVGEIVSEHKPM